MSKPPSSSELAEQYHRLSKRHASLSEAYDKEASDYNRQVARAEAAASKLREKRHLLAEEDRLCKRGSTRKAFRDELRRDILALENRANPPNALPLKRATKHLRLCEKDMRAWVDYVQHCRALGYVFPTEISQMCAAYNYRRRFPERYDDDDDD